MKAIMTLLLMCPLIVYGQQDPLYAQYLTTPILINPAYAGYSKDLNGSVSYRKQWGNFDGSPVTMNAAGHLALRDNRMGVGVIFIRDEIGSDRTTEAQVTYAYHLPLSRDITLSFGLLGGAINYRSDYSNLLINRNDPKFTSISEWKPNLGSGIMLTSERFMVSLAIPKMLNDLQKNNTLSSGLYNRNFYGLAAYIVNINTRIRLKPYMLMRSTTGAPTSLDYGISLGVDNSYTLGVFTRDLNALGFLAQIKLGDQMRFGYVFELPINQFTATRFTTHEFMVGMRLRMLSFHDISSIRNF